jgi:hypothetical protein
LNVFLDIDGEVLDDEVITIRSSGPTGELEVFQPYSGVFLLGVLGDVSGRSEAQWEWHFLDAMIEGPQARAVRTKARITILIARSVAMPRGCLLVLSLGLVSISRIHGGPVNIGTTAGQLA